MLALGYSLAVLIIARILQGINTAVVWTIRHAMVLDTVGPQHLGKFVGSIFSFISIGELTSPVAGGVLHEKTGYVGVFGLGSGILALDFLMRLLMVGKRTAAKYYDEPGNNQTNTRDFGTRGSADPSPGYSQP
ncbi:hypothetical protein F5Y16DRAFT_360221 [Xylariaceae sp. FL0255]|nr:hypothetical protein F5Y16DRAFT_360221 [Xylariaceae sp. FL0255]